MKRLMGCALVGLLALAITPDTFGRGRHGGHSGFRAGQAAVTPVWSGGPTPNQLAAACPAAPVASGEPAGETAPVQTGRYLRVKNDTDQKLTVYLQYRTWTSRSRYRWYPEDPAKATKALVFELEPGSETDLYHDDWPINAVRVRLWAVAADNSEWLEYKDKNLWLVEKDAEGYCCYYAPEMETYTFTFAR